MLSGFLSLSLLVLNLSYAPIWDSPRPDVSWFQPSPQKVSPELSAYAILEEASEKMEYPRGHPKLRNWVSEPETSSRTTRETLIQELLQYDKVLNQLKGQVHFRPEISYEGVKKMNVLFLRDLAFYQQLLTFHAIEDGDPEKAIHYAIESIEFSLNITGKGGSLIHEMVASMMLGLALENVERILSAFPDHPPSSLMRSLLSIPDMRKAGWSMLQAEARFMWDYQEDRPHLPTFMETGIIILTWDFSAWWLELPAPPLLFHPNRTTGYYFEQFQRWKTYLETPPSKRAEVPPPEPLNVKPDIRNYVGIRVFNSLDVLMKPIEVLQEKEAKSHALILMTFQNRNQVPPDSWVYDPFTGNALKVTEDGTEVISTGPDQQFGTGDDVTFPIPESLRK